MTPMLVKLARLWGNSGLPAPVPTDSDSPSASSSSTDALGDTLEPSAIAVAAAVVWLNDKADDENALRLFALCGGDDRLIVDAISRAKRLVNADYLLARAFGEPAA